MSTVGSKNRTVPLEPRIPQQQGPRLQNGGHQKGHKNRAPSADLTEMVVVAIDATKEVTKHALEWALSNVVQPGDYITLLAILPATASGRKLWSFPKLGGDCAAGLRSQGAQLEDEINEACTFMMQQLHKLCDAKKVHVRVKVVPGAARGAIALEAQQLGATWVVLDRHLKKEGKVCMDQLQCNLVIVKRLNPKILRLNLKRSSKIAGGLPFEDGSMDSSSVLLEGLSYIGVPKGFEQSLGQISMAGVGFLNSDRDTPLSSPEMGTPFTTTEIGTSSNSSSEPSNSPYPDAVYANSELETADARLTDILSSTTPDTLERPRGYPTSESDNDDSSPSGPLGRDLEPIFSDKKPSFLQTETTHISGPRVKSRMPSRSLGESPKMDDKIVSSFRKASPGISGKRISTDSKFSSSFREGGSAQTLRSIMSPASDSPSLKRAVPNDRQMLSDLFNSLKGAVEERQKLGQPTRAGQQRRDESQGKPHQDGLADSFKPKQGDLERTSSVRKAMSLSRHAPPGPPPLCSICQHKAPVFGKPPKRFSFAELELATGGFSQANFLAEGGFGSVHRGVLPDGQAVAVKQHKLASSQGDMEFCSEVEVLSCAQHRNVVMLIGYCVEDRRRLLVYEFVCNRSLDSHLYGKNGNTLEWASRQKIAVGAARGLRYLHEECRVGCIVHRDMRPNNILLTHDFEPMVGDFGLARWQPDGDCAVDTRVIGTFGYLAPEYAQSGQITEKADVYSFGVVLLELVSGRKAVDINRPKGQQCLTEWARPLLEERASNELVDPRLENRFADYEVYCMLHAASLCIRRDAHLRPRMSQVLRILEGDMMVDANGSPSIGRSYDPMSGSGRFVTESRFVADMYTYSGKISHHSTESSISLSGPISPPHSLMGFSGGKFANDPLSGQHGKLSHEALKAAYRDKGNLSARLSIEALR